MEKEVRLVAEKRHRAQAAAATETSTGSQGQTNIRHMGQRLKHSGHVAQQWVPATYHKILLMSTKRQNQKGKISLCVVASTTGKVIERSLPRLWLSDYFIKVH